MTEKITALVLDITRHNDRVNVVTLYTRSRGRVAFLSPAGAGKGNRLRQARLQPLAVIEADVSFRAASELQRLGQFSLHTVWRDIYFDPVKSMMALFLSEFLNKLLRASMPDENLWDYIYESLVLLDNIRGKGLPNFHIAFLSSLLPFMGIQPDTSEYESGDIFDMQSGTFLSGGFASGTGNLRSPYQLRGEEARFVTVINRLNFSNVSRLRLGREERRRILKGLLQYYGVHFPGAGNLKSLEVMREIFD